MNAATRQSPSFRWPALCTMWFVLVLARAADAQVIQLPRPGERDFIVDKADLITPEDEQAIRQTADKLLTDTASPIIVVTLESMAQYLRPDRELPWETFSRVLFDEWGIGHATLGNPPNSGILLLVSRDDRKARIELGTGWTIERDAEVQGVMQHEIIPRFKQGDFSQGIRAGVAALDRMARRPAGAADASGAGASPMSGAGSSSGAQGAQPAPFSFPSGSASGGGNAGRFGSLLGCGVIGLIVALAVVWLITRGMGGGLTRNSVHRSRGWYGGFYPGMWYGMGGPWGWGGTYGGNPGGWSGGRSSGGGMSGGGGGGFSGGGFSGGSFGGGFSGGRGASGSW